MCVCVCVCVLFVADVTGLKIWTAAGNVGTSFRVNGGVKIKQSH